MTDFLKEEKIFDYKLSNNQISFEFKRMQCFIVFDGYKFTVDFKCIDDIKIVNTIEEVIEKIKFKFDFIKDNKESVDEMLNLLYKLDGTTSNWGIMGGVDDNQESDWEIKKNGDK